MKFEPAELDGVSDNVNAVVEASPLNVCNFGDKLVPLGGTDNWVLPRYTIKILSPFAGTDAKVILGCDASNETLNAKFGSCNTPLNLPLIVL